MFRTNRHIFTIWKVEFDELYNWGDAVKSSAARPE
jgi:hypothetical protein